MKDGRRLVGLAGAVLILAAPAFPVIRVIFTSPQYPTESPSLRLYTHRIEGHTHEFQVLTRYVGLEFPPDVPELRSNVVPWIVVGLGALALVASLLPWKPRRFLAAGVLVGVTALAGWAQYRFYQSGHQLNPEAPMRTTVKPFTPPLFGVIRMHRIRIYHLPDAGSLMMIGGCVALAWSSRRPKRRGAKGEPAPAAAVPSTA